MELIEVWNAYQTFQEAHPFLGSVATATAMFTAADYISQKLESPNLERTVEEHTYNHPLAQLFPRIAENIGYHTKNIVHKVKNGEVDAKRLSYNAKLGPVYGTLIYGLVESGNLVGDTIENVEWAKEAIPDQWKPLVQSALGPNLWGLGFNVGVYLNNALGAERGYRFIETCKHYASLVSPESLKQPWQTVKSDVMDKIDNRELAKAAVGTITFWNAFHTFVYTTLTDDLEAYQTPATLAVSLGWITAMTWWSNKNTSSRAALE